RVGGGAGRFTCHDAEHGGDGFPDVVDAARDVPGQREVPELAFHGPVGADGQRVEPQDRVQTKLFTATGGDHRDLVDPPGTVGPPAQVHDRVDGVVDLVADRVVGHVPLTHGGKGLQPVDGVVGGVGVHGHQRPVVAGVHGLEHVDGLRTTHLTDDDAVGPHA